MKHLMSYNEYYQKHNKKFKLQKYSVGDVVRLKNNKIARIVKINSKYSYIVNIVKDGTFSKKPIEVREHEISHIIRSNNEPAVEKDFIIGPYVDVSNLRVINWYADTPIPNVLGY